MQLTEKLGTLYIGKEYDLAGVRRLDQPVMYDARDLTTHAVCIGMTGSGKTGLCIGLLEEAAIDGVPALIIDPKGDITNLLLTFPGLRPEDFRPWINLDEAARKGMDPDAYAKSVASAWRAGLAEWDQGPERIERLRGSADFRIYTPRSDAGRPVSILNSFKAPALDWEEHAEFLREEIQGVVSALLGLAGIQGDPLRSREHILLSSLFEHFWRGGRDLDLAALIQAVQAPPVQRMGVFDLESFFPEKERFTLAMVLNNLLASPGFAPWMQGEPLDPTALLYTEEGKPRHAIFYIAHLEEDERMFFVTLLLQKVIGWMRRQPGTSSLRALLYMDEVFGYLPPVSAPPSKKPLLTLLKQARAFGLGVVLTTQNPVDLDYKGLSNAGTWFIGKLQTERDKSRLLDGLESAAGAAGGALDRAGLDQALSRLGPRVFLLHNVHEEHPVVFETRWCMSYLRGPLTRAELRRLKEAAGDRQEDAVSGAVSKPGPVSPAGGVSGDFPERYSSFPPNLPPDIPQVYLPVRKGAARALAELEEKLGMGVDVSQEQLVYQPALLAFGRVRFADRARGVGEERRIGLLVGPESLGMTVCWQEGEPVAIGPEDLVSQFEEGALFAEVPEGLSRSVDMKGYAKDFGEWLYREQALPLFYQPVLKLYSAPAESERDFRVRVREAAREQRDAEVETLRRKTHREMDRLEAKLEREQRELVQDEEDYRARQREELISGAETLAGFLGIFGRRRGTGLSRAATRRRMTSSAKADVEESREVIARLEDDLAALREELQLEANGVIQRWEKVLDQIEDVSIRPRRTDVSADRVALGWSPAWVLVSKSRSGDLGRHRIDAWR